MRNDMSLIVLLCFGFGQNSKPPFWIDVCNFFNYAGNWKFNAENTVGRNGDFVSVSVPQQNHVPLFIYFFRKKKKLAVGLKMKNEKKMWENENKNRKRQNGTVRFLIETVRYTVF